MNIFKSLLILPFFLLSCESDPVGNKHTNGTISKSIAEMAWLIGDWQDTLRPKQWEIWSKNDHGMYGQGVAIRAADTVRFEELSLVEDNGDLIYIANVKGGGIPVKFVNTELSSNRATFENPSHDFPKIISYEMYYEDNKQLLHAAVSGDNKKIDLYYIKR